MLKARQTQHKGVGSGLWLWLPSSFCRCLRHNFGSLVNVFGGALAQRGVHQPFVLHAGYELGDERLIIKCPLDVVRLSHSVSC